jgi:hypothetical protein
VHAPESGRRLEILFGVVSLGVALMVATVPLLFALPASVALVSLLARARERHAVAIVSSTVLLMLGVVELALRAIPEDAGPQYYRPHETLAGFEFEGGLLGYRPNQQIEDFAMPHGDLANLSQLGTAVQPRIVDFHTDSLGYRNRQDYRGEAFVLFGDSLVVGNGNTQAAILSEVLTNTHRIPVYNAAYPGEIEDYIARLHRLEGIHGEGFGAIVVVFEGNDFRCSREQRRGSRTRWSRVYQYIPKFARKLESYRVLYGLTRRAYHVHLVRDQVEEDLSVFVERYGAEELAFLKSYREKATDPEECTWEEHRSLLASVSDRIVLLVFVPTKYRVYGSLSRGRDEPLPASTSSAFMQQLARELSIPYLDLTRHLAEASGELLEEGRYTFWRDDTHWNANGIRTAAAAIADRLRAERLVPNEPAGSGVLP